MDAGVEITDIVHSTLHRAFKMQSFICKNNLETHTHEYKGAARHCRPLWLPCRQWTRYASTTCLESSCIRLHIPSFIIYVHITAGKKRAGSIYYALDKSKNFPLGERSSEGTDPSLINRNLDTSDMKYAAEKASEMYVSVRRWWLDAFVSACYSGSFLLTFKWYYCRSQQGSWETVPRLAQNQSDLSRIAFGQTATNGAMEFAVYLEIDAGGGYYTCGGSLIGKTTVVTAAHCFFGDDGSLSAVSATATIGQRNIRNPPSKYVYDVVGVLRPKEYSPGYSNDLVGDIALLELNRPVTTGKKVTLASYSTKVPQWFITAGWGLTEDNKRASETLQYAAVPSLTVSQVNSWVKYSGTYYQMEPDHIAAGLGSDRADSCSGDSGGPLFKPGKDFTNAESNSDVLFGVVSYGFSSRCGARQNMNIGFYTSIPYWKNWIRKEMKKRKWN